MKLSVNLRILKFVCIATGIILFLSFAIGTSMFNRYCDMALSNPLDGMVFRWDSSFSNCHLNTLTLNPTVLLFGAYLLQYVFHVFLFTMEGKRDIFKNIIYTLFFGLLTIFLFSLLLLAFPMLVRGFQEGGARVTQGMDSLRAVSGLSGSRPNILWNFFYLFGIIPLMLQAGVILLSLLINKLKVEVFKSTGLNQFIYLFFGSLAVQIVLQILMSSMIYPIIFNRSTVGFPTISDTKPGVNLEMGLGNR